jgi:hypothetical protein
MVPKEYSLNLRANDFTDLTLILIYYKRYKMHEDFASSNFQ